MTGAAEIVACFLFASILLVICVYWYTEKITTESVRRETREEVKTLLDAREQEIARRFAEQQAKWATVEGQIRSNSSAIQAIERLMQAYRREIQTLRQVQTVDIEKLKEDLLSADSLQRAVITQQARLTVVEDKANAILRLDDRVAWAERVLRAAIARQKAQPTATRPPPPPPPPTTTPSPPPPTTSSPQAAASAAQTTPHRRAVLRRAPLRVLKPTTEKKRRDQSRLSRQIREAANWTCAMCRVVCKGGYSSLLHMHHVDGNHKNNKLENLMALCVECHSQMPGIGHKLLGDEIACDGRLKRVVRLRRAQGLVQ